MKCNSNMNSSAESNLCHKTSLILSAFKEEIFVLFKTACELNNTSLVGNLECTKLKRQFPFTDYQWKKLIVIHYSEERYYWFQNMSKYKKFLDGPKLLTDDYRIGVILHFPRLGCKKNGVNLHHQLDLRPHHFVLWIDTVLHGGSKQQT